MKLSDACIYQIYPLGFCGAPLENDHQYQNRIMKVNDWVKHIKTCGFNTILFNPLFESVAHGYDIADYQKIDSRLGNNDDFKQVCDNLHQNGISVILDGVFNHCGRDFFGFKDVLQNRENSAYRDWFDIDFYNNNNYNDGLSYQCWEGCDNLIKFNLRNDDVKNYLFESIKMWIDEFNIDGLRLDVAYCLDRDFLRQLHQFTKSINPDFILIGEIIHGDYNQIVNDEMLDSCTNYECYKGMYSSLNSMNLFEISYSLNRQFGKENWCLYTGKILMNFTDNHDVTRAASVITNKSHLPLLYSLLYTIPGVPCVYYGSEFEATGLKQDGDACLRLSYDKPLSTPLTKYITLLNKIRSKHHTLAYGDYTNLVERNQQLLFKRESDEECLLCLFNIDENDFTFEHGELSGNFIDLVTNKELSLEGNLNVAGYTSLILKKI